MEAVPSSGGLSFRPLTPALGAEVLGVDLAAPMSEDTFRKIEEAFNQYSVLVFRGQDLTEDQHVAFSRRFGELEIHVRSDAVKKTHPELFVVSNVIENGKPIGSIDAGQFWHTDLSYKKEPSRGSLLLSREVPVKDGVARGDTLFVSTAAAYDALDEPTKAELAPLYAVHHYEKGYLRDRPSGKRPPLTDAQRRAVPDVEHPVVRTHPYTGRKCLFVNEGYTTEIVGMEKEAGQRLLNRLFEHCVRPEFQYRHRWQVGDLVMWDNCATQHLAVNDYDATMRRRMERTTLKGSAPF
ncbi:TauD/TfdA family dioxygenase [Pigmentiphaga soli]|uniref:TauD/TfdA family dioxygenase n=1 Tax=Pigmentiphaga soli TaxID=1007095 RepID=A0ABP8HTJ6_9BURK